MAQQLYFSRDTRMFVQFRNPADNTEAAAKLGAGTVWEIPVLDGVYRILQDGIVSSLSDANRKASGFDVFSDYKNQIIFDPQTGGGLLAIIEKENEKQILNQLKSQNISASIIGTVIEEETIKVV